MQTTIQNHGTLKVTKSKILVHYKTISGSDIYSNFLFLVAITRCDTASSINGVGKATVFKKHLEEAALVFTANRKLHEEIELAEKNSVSYLPEQNRHSLNYRRRKQLILKVITTKYLQPNQL